MKLISATISLYKISNYNYEYRIFRVLCVTFIDASFAELQALYLAATLFFSMLRPSHQGAAQSLLVTEDDNANLELSSLLCR